MSDREKVINDQQREIEELEERLAIVLEGQPEIVRCKYCKDACIYSDDWVICTHIDSNGNDKHPVDWFCADGVRK